jgi:muconolactone delta-isomerase
MKILAIEHDLPDVNDSQFTETLLQAEARCAWELHQAGILRELYFRADRDEVVLVLECANVAEARGVLDTLPLVREKLIEFEVIPLTAYPGFARLFADDA